VVRARHAGAADAGDDPRVENRTPPLRAVLADDDRLFREAAAATLGAQPELELRAVLHDGTQVVEEVRRHRADVLVTDWSMPGAGASMVAEAVRAVPHLRVVVVPGHDDAATALGAVLAGARGVVSKVGLDVDLGRCVVRCALGDVVLVGPGPAAVLEVLVNAFPRRPAG
jgi:DNA-binding NarL/FixJ family response regulator